MPRKLGITIFALLLLCAAGFFIYIKFLRPRPFIYSGFGIAIPPGSQHIGIDVSHYQHKIDWSYVAAMTDHDKRISFVFIKATEGCGSSDRRFAANWEQAGRNGLVRGAYHYFHPAQDAAQQAARFIATASLDTGDLKPVLDVEVTEGLAPQALRDSICKWLSIIECRYRTAPVIYTSSSFYNDHLLGFFDTYPLWIAHYKAASPSVKKSWHFWQFSDCGRVNGIGCKVDFNIFAGDSLMWRQLIL